MELVTQRFQTLKAREGAACPILSKEYDEEFLCHVLSVAASYYRFAMLNISTRGEMIINDERINTSKLVSKLVAAQKLDARENSNTAAARLQASSLALRHELREANDTTHQLIALRDTRVEIVTYDSEEYTVIYNNGQISPDVSLEAALLARAADESSFGRQEISQVRARARYTAEEEREHSERIAQCSATLAATEINKDRAILREKLAHLNAGHVHFTTAANTAAIAALASERARKRRRLRLCGYATPSSVLGRPPGGLARRSSEEDPVCPPPGRTDTLAAAKITSCLAEALLCFRGEKPGPYVVSCDKPALPPLAPVDRELLLYPADLSEHGMRLATPRDPCCNLADFRSQAIVAPRLGPVKHKTPTSPGVEDEATKRMLCVLRSTPDATFLANWKRMLTLAKVQGAMENALPLVRKRMQELADRRAGRPAYLTSLAGDDDLFSHIVGYINGVGDCAALRGAARIFHNSPALRAREPKISWSKTSRQWPATAVEHRHGTLVDVAVLFGHNSGHNLQFTELPLGRYFVGEPRLDVVLVFDSTLKEMVPDTLLGPALRLPKTDGPAGFARLSSRAQTLRTHATVRLCTLSSNHKHAMRRANDQEVEAARADLNSPGGTLRLREALATRARNSERQHFRLHVTARATTRVGGEVVTLTGYSPPFTIVSKRSTKEQQEASKKRKRKARSEE